MFPSSQWEASCCPDSFEWQFENSNVSTLNMINLIFLVNLEFYFEGYSLAGCIMSTLYNNVAGGVSQSTKLEQPS